MTPRDLSRIGRWSWLQIPGFGCAGTLVGDGAMSRHKRLREEDTPAGSEYVHPSRKKRFKYTPEDAQLAKLYNDLADNVQTVRIKAAGDLLKNLSAKSPDQPQRLETAETRLIKGLCSGRKAARLGFSIALAEVFRLKFRSDTESGHDIILVPTVDHIVQLTETEGNVSGLEKRDHLLGRRFALQALLHSDVGLEKELPDVQWHSLLQAMFDLAASKQWLRRDVGAMLYDYMISQSGGKLNDTCVQAIVEAASSSKQLRTPEGVGLWLTVQDRFSGVSLPKGVWHHNDPLSSKERQVLSKVLLESAIHDDAMAKQTGTRQAAPGFVWDIILSRLFNDENDKNFAKFWESCVASTMFSASSSTERRSLGLQVFNLALSSAPKSKLPDVIHGNVLRCILDQRASPERYLFDAAKAPLELMVRLAKRSPDVAGILFRELIQKGAVNLDQLTKTKTLESIVGHADDTSLSTVVATVQRSFVDSTSEKDPNAENHKRYLGDTLLAVVRSRKDASQALTMLPSKQSNAYVFWLERLLTTLTTFSYDGLPGSNVVRSRLMSCLNCLMDNPMEHAIKAPILVARIASTHSRSNARLDKRTQEVVTNAKTSFEKSVAQSSEAGSRAFALLLALSILQVYGEEADAVAALEDLVTCHQSQDESSKNESTIMLVELLLSFISKPSTLFRKLAEQVFSAFAAELNAESLQSMVDILGQKEGLSGQQELFNQGDEDSEEEEEDVEDVEEASDVELTNGHGASDPESEEDNESDEASSDAEEGASDDEEAIFDKKLAEALGTGRAEDDEGSDDDGSDMDDEQTMALEPHLASIFKERQTTTSKTQDKKDAKENVVNFKNRVLDLLMIYVKSQYDSILALDLILPLSTLVRTTSNKPTAEKAFAVLKAYFDACSKHKSLPQPSHGDKEAVFEVLTAVHDEMKRGGSKMHASACSRSSLFLSKVLVALEAKHYQQIAGMYANLQSQWYLEPKSKLQASVFTEWNSWSIATRKQHG
ncbi:DNA-directed DNA polymerase [Vermiconidia calcicola]|uniref:DNA-directed DNA polymerase n=1 Tax=Vermiconidia calcicola TaxID=1690605 RepID=A0ACC3N2X5_9PEZI|nr:DNA-directed DNA polymerase [Vermiconidia calcicola]